MPHTHARTRSLRLVKYVLLGRHIPYVHTQNEVVISSIQYVCVFDLYVRVSRESGGVGSVRGAHRGVRMYMERGWAGEAAIMCAA